jgi:hypothetical protein
LKDRQVGLCKYVAELKKLRTKEEKQKILDELSNLSTAKEKYQLFEKLAKEKADF